MNPDRIKTPVSSRESKIKQLQAELEAIFALGGSVLGHGTPTAELAENMLRVGLVSSYNKDLSSSVVPLDRGEINQVLNWAHKDHKYIVVISIPGSYQRSQGEMTWGERLFEEITEEDDARSTIPHFKPSRFNKSSNAKLSPRYIAGYIDAKELQFVKNPAFEEDPKLPDPVASKGSHLDLMSKNRGIEPLQGVPEEKPVKSDAGLPEDPDIW